MSNALRLARPSTVRDPLTNVELPEIESGIPFNEQTGIRERHLQRMKVGDSFLVGSNNERCNWINASGYLRKRGTPLRIVTRKLRDGSGYRIWRLE